MLVHVADVLDRAQGANVQVGKWWMSWTARRLKWWMSWTARRAPMCRLACFESALVREDCAPGCRKAQVQTESMNLKCLRFLFLGSGSPRESTRMAAVDAADATDDGSGLGGSTAVGCGHVDGCIDARCRGSIVGSYTSAAAAERLDSVLLLLALLDGIKQRENLLEDSPNLGQCSVLLRHLVSAGRYNWSPRGETPYSAPCLGQSGKICGTKSQPSKNIDF